MPVRLHPSLNSHDSTSRDALRIGLVNSMPKAAFEATEHQFLHLLNSASEGIPIELSRYVLRGIPWAGSEGNRTASGYASVDDLLDRSLDGLIVTGTEPTADSLKDEPYWGSFIQLLDWARDNTHSAVWSCLAAHAATLYMDGIERRRACSKHFGIFQCHRVAEDRLLRGTAPRFSVPHSRWNGVVEQDLEETGYLVLSRTEHGQVDTFTKRENSLFVFFQGHLEYATDTLLREYRRDIGRYLRNQSETYPRIPEGYFDEASREALSSLGHGDNQSNGKLLAAVAAVIERVQIDNTWQPTAAHMYRNWLEYLLACREARLSPPTVDTSQTACQ